MHVAGLPAPLLQVELRGTSGKRYIGDFYWPQSMLVGEFDGAAKYRDPAFLRGRTPEQALMDEKDREDDLRAAGYGVRRWGWAIATDASRLRTHLTKAGLEANRANQR